MLNRAAIVPILWSPLFYDQTRFSGMPAVPFACGQSRAQSLRWASATSSISRRPLAFSARFQDSRDDRIAAPATFVPSRQKQRASLVLTKVQERAGGCGIWQAGQGPAADETGDIYVMTGNYGNEDAAPAVGDLPESFIKLHYTPPADNTSQGKLEPVGWFTPSRDVDRADLSGQGQDNFKDYDLSSGGPVPIPGMSLVLGAGKDGVVYVLDKDTPKFGKGSDYAVLKQPPLFFAYFPGFEIDAAQVRNLDRLYTGKTHHLHGTPAFWHSPTHGPLLFVWGENECLRAWTLSETGELKFLAKSAEVASAGMGGKGGMPGGFLAVTSDGATPNTGIVWTLTPLSGDANTHVVRGILRAYDATNLDPISNSDGTPRLKLPWHSDHIPNNAFNHNKFFPPVVADGKVFIQIYDGRVDVYGLHLTAKGRPRPTNA
jgi:hypothetical protein